MRINFRHFIIFIGFIGLIYGCGKSPEEEVSAAVFQANRLLSRGQCQLALDVLNSTTGPTQTASFITTLSSAYACRANFSEITLFSDDLSKIGSPTELGGFTQFTNSNDEVGEERYNDLQRAIEVLLFSNKKLDSDENIKFSDRVQSVGELAALDHEAMILYQSMAQIGRFLENYGNTDNNGNKGQGSGGNGCVVNYSNVNFDSGPFNDMNQFLSAGSTGSCSSLGDGHPDLGTPGNFDLPRLCEGVVLMNIFIDAFTTILDNFTGDQLSELESIRSDIETAQLALITAKNGTDDVLELTSFEKCEEDNQANDENIQVWYAFLIEGLFR